MVTIFARSPPQTICPQEKSMLVVQKCQSPSKVPSLVFKWKGLITILNLWHKLFLIFFARVWLHKKLSFNCYFIRLFNCFIPQKHKFAPKLLFYAVYSGRVDCLYIPLCCVFLETYTVQYSMLCIPRRIHSLLFYAVYSQQGRLSNILCFVLLGGQTVQLPYSV